MRKGKLELRKAYGNTKLFEVVKWYPNKYYGKEAEYDISPSGDSYMPKGSTNCFIHKDCFLKPESCFVVAWIENGVIEFVGSRPNELETMIEMRDFLNLLEKGIVKSLKYKP